MIKLIRIDHGHFIYVVPPNAVSSETATRVTRQAREWWPNARILVVAADEYMDASGMPIDTIGPSDVGPT